MSLSSQFLPFDIQVEILNRMNDVKSLMRLRSISKAWNSHIVSPKFIADHHQRQRRHLILIKDDIYQSPFSAIVDNDDSFPQDQYSFALPSTLFRSHIVYIGSSSHGLLGYYRWRGDTNLDIVLWNPSVRRSVAIRVPNVLDPSKIETNVGFGVCPGSNDPKLVKIVTSRIPFDQYYNDYLMMPLEVEVCTLSSGVWRSPLGISKLPRKTISLPTWSVQVVINSIIYWLACEDEYSQLIISFDLTTEEFEEIYLPDNLNVSTLPLSLANRRESLVVLVGSGEAQTRECGVWVMNHHPKSFTKLYSVIKEELPRNSFFQILGFRKNGDPILETRYGIYESALELYDPCSECFSDLGFRTCTRYTVTSYTESLLLLDHQSARFYH